MAGQKLQIDIGTSYNGQGINKAKSGVSGLGNVIQTTSRNSGQLFQHIGKLSGSLGGLAGKAGQAANAVGGLAGAFRSFGPLGMVVGGLFSVFMLGYEKVKQAEEERKKRLEEQAEKMRYAYTEGALQAYRNHLERVNEAENKRTAAIKAQISAQERLNKLLKDKQQANFDLGKTRNEGRMAQLRRDTQNAIDAETDPTEKRIAEVYGRRKEVAYQGKVDTRYAELDVERARRARADIGKQQASNLANIQDLKVWVDALGAKQKYAKTFQGSYGTKEEGQLRLKKATEDLEKAQSKLFEAENKRKELAIEMETAEKKLATAEEKLNNVKANADFNNQQANQAVKQAEQARQEEIYQQMVKEQAEEDAKRQKEMLRSEIEAMEYGQKEWNDRLNEVISELKKIDEQEKQVKKAIEDRQNIINNSNNVNGSGLNGQNRYGQYNWQTDAEGRNNVGEIGRARRMGEGQGRDAASRRNGYKLDKDGNVELTDQGKRWKKEMDDLQRQQDAGKKLSDRDQKRLKDRKDWFDQFPDKDRDAKKKQLEEQKDDLTQKLQQAAKDITWKVKEEQGLK